MLHFMRRFASSWGGKILGAALIVALASFGVPSILATLDANTITRVGDEDVTATDFMRLYQQNLNAFSQQTGQFLTNEQAIQFGIPTSVLSQLTTRAAINQFASRNGIGVSETKVDELGRADPNFFGPLGTFDPAVYQQVLRQLGMTAEQYRDTQRRTARRQQVALGLFAGSAINQTGAELYNRYANDLRTIEYFTLNEFSIVTPADPTEEELTAYLAENQAQYRTRETRTADIIYLTIENLAALPAYQPTEEDVLAEYERIKDTLTRTERRTVQQVILPNADAEQIFVDQQAAGADFATALAASGLTAVNLGTLARAEITDSALANAAFGLADAGDYTIIPGIGGRRVVAVTAIEAGGQTPFEDARAELVTRLATAEARASYLDTLDQIEELRAAFQPLTQIGERFGIPVTTVEVTAGGPELLAVPRLAEADRPRAAQAIFAATVGNLAPTIAYGANHNLWFDLTAVEEARDQTLDEVRDAVTTALTQQRVTEEMRSESEAIVAELESGRAIADIAAERGLIATVSAPFGRTGDSTPIINQDVATSVFAGPVGTNGWAVNGDGDNIVYQVIDVLPPSDPPSAQITESLTSANRDALYADFVTGLTDELWPPSVRGSAYQRMLTLLTTTTTQ